ncbi:MAG TPA: alpha/beta fold hydrolase [Holophagaceae bacterium]|nr:alpha/beta fold hydrolase [Holophagaceae bacterium]
MDTKLRLLRAAIQGTDRLAPDLARRWAQRLFVTPPRHAPTAAERAVLAEARPFRFRSGTLSLQAWRWGEGPAVILVHGWGGRGGQLHPFVAPLRAAGFAVLALDGPGHGQSEGRTATVPRFAEALLDLAAQEGPFHGLLGHSFGGATSAFALSRGIGAARAVVIAAPESPEIFYRELLGALGFQEGRQDRFLRALERDFGVRFEDVRTPALAPDFRTPGLVIHDAGDKEVPFAHGQALAAAWPGARFIATTGLGHRRILKDPAVIAESVAFLKEGAPTATGPLAAGLGEGASGLEWHLLRRDLRPLPASQPVG